MFEVEEVGHKTAYKGFFRIDVRQFRHERFDGTMSPVLTRELFERGNSVAVLPYDPVADAVVLIRQFLVGAHYSGLMNAPLQVIAGSMDHGTEGAEEVALREAREEAGLVVSGLRKIATYLPSPGGSTEAIALFCALVDSRGVAGIHGLEEENENIRVEVLPAEEAIRLLDAGEITPSPAVIALHWLARNREALRLSSPERSG
jgi:ADP-ribose pyrophosphatase